MQPRQDRLLRLNLLTRANSAKLPEPSDTQPASLVRYRSSHDVCF